VRYLFIPAAPYHYFYLFLTHVQNKNTSVVIHPASQQTVGIPLKNGLTEARRLLDSLKRRKSKKKHPQIIIINKSNCEVLLHHSWVVVISFYKDVSADG